MRHTVLVADDELNALSYLERYVESHNSLELIGSLKNGQEVINFCQLRVPDIILMDIEMPGISGVEAARELVRMDLHPFIIFITAYNEYAVAAFELAAFSYILKPFVYKDLDIVIRRALDQFEIIEKATFNSQIERLWESHRKTSWSGMQSITFKEKGLIKEVKFDEVLYIKSDSELLRFITQKSIHTRRLTIKTIISQLPPYFRQVHRSYLINEERIQSWKYLRNSTYEFQLLNGDKIVSSRSFQPEIRSWLKD